MNTVVQEQKKAPVAKYVACGCVALILAGVAVIGGLFLFLSGIPKSSIPYKDSVAAVKESPAAMAALGEPIEVGFFVTWRIRTANGEETASLDIPASGPKGKGKVIVYAKRPVGGQWKYEILELEVEGNPNPIPLGK